MDKNNLVLNLTPGITETAQYKAWKFPGGEIHIVLKLEFQALLSNSDKEVDIEIITRINNSDDLIFLCLVADTITKTWQNDVHVFMPYMPYQQADRDFAEGECFSLKTIINILNNLDVNKYTVFDAHSDVTAAMLKGCHVIDNSKFIDSVLDMLLTVNSADTKDYFSERLVLMSPDAGAYKKIFKLADKVAFTGNIETANKYRDTSNGEIETRFSCEDFGGKDILIVDDICIGGRTFIALAEQLKKRNAGKLYLAVSHGIFSNGLLELGKYFSSVFTTNSRQNEYEEMIKVVQLAQGNSVDFQHKDHFQLHCFEVI